MMAKEQSKIKPDHYKQGETDLIEVWKLIFPPDHFRSIMKALSMRYFMRFENKNGIEDIEKGEEVIRRLKEFEKNQGGENKENRLRAFSAETGEEIKFDIEKSFKRNADKLTTMNRDEMIEEIKRLNKGWKNTLERNSQLTRSIVEVEKALAHFQNQIIDKNIEVLDLELKLKQAQDCASHYNSKLIQKNIEHTALQHKYKRLKVVEETGELAEGLAKRHTADIKDAIGDVYVTLLKEEDLK